MQYLRFLLIVIMLATPGRGRSQDFIGVGASAMYNLQTNGIGFGVRGQFPIVINLSVVPQVYYFPSFNKVNELFMGASLHYEWRRWHKFTPYVLAGAFYNHWTNAEVSGYITAKPNNFIPEAGVGILFLSNCWRPFIEQRYNPVWKEGTFRLGIMWYPMMCGVVSKHQGTNRKTYDCPKIGNKK
jgi:hypothetical protein